MNRRVIIMITVYVFILLLIGIFRPREIDWRTTFGSGDKIPYGAYIAYHRLADFFPKGKITTTEETIYQTMHGKSFSHTNYILIENNFQPSGSDTRELLHFAEAGNTVFISARSMSYNFLDTLGLSLEYHFNGLLGKIAPADSIPHLYISMCNPTISDSVFKFEAGNTPQFFAVSKKDKLDSTASYSMPIDTVADAAIPTDSDIATVNNSGDSTSNITESDDDLPLDGTPYHNGNFTPLATHVIALSKVAHEFPNYVKIPYGKGAIYLHSYPFAFSNYYLINDTTRGYAEHCLSYLPADADVIWDEHYHIGGSQERHLSTMEFILTNSSLRWAYFTAILFIILFFIFSLKRRQRIIPVVLPFRNTSLEFAETVGRLYFNRGDHKNIAEKKIKHLLEYIRSRYYLDTNELNAEFINKLHVKSGIDKERVAFMMNIVIDVINKRQIPTSELIQLNELIEYFKKHSN